MPKLDSLYKGTDVIDACSAVNQVLKKEWFYYNTDFSLPHLGGDYLFTTRVGYCRDACDVATYTMRSDLYLLAGSENLALLECSQGYHRSVLPFLVYKR